MRYGIHVSKKSHSIIVQEYIWNMKHGKGCEWSRYDSGRTAYHNMVYNRGEMVAFREVNADDLFFTLSGEVKTAGDPDWKDKTRLKNNHDY